MPAMPVITTWNLENLYRPGGSYGPRSQDVYDRKLTYLTDRINAIAPDIIAVQEVGDPAALEDLAARLADTWEIALSTHPDPRGIRVGFLSRTPLTIVGEVTVLPAPLLPVQAGDAATDRNGSMGRGALHVRTTAAGAGLDLVTVHLKSKLLSYPNGRFNPRDEDERARYGAYALYRRTMEAATVRIYANDVLKAGAENLVVLGDMNDSPLAATTQILYGPDGSQLDTPGFGRPDAGDAYRLWNTAPRIPDAHRFSRLHLGDRELIDHILISHSLAQNLTNADAYIQDITTVGNNPSSRRDATIPDHAPVTVALG
jgi:endonuclease/exonuclease/phosphatase family metal-dependent hydrolase